MKKQVLIVIAFKNFQDREFLICKRILEKQGVEITVASKFLGSASGVLGNKVKINIVLSKISEKNGIKEFDALIFIGGQGAVDYIDDHICHKIVQDAFNEKKVIAAICIAPAILAQAGILENKVATVWVNELNKKLLKIFKQANVNYQKQDVVVDKKHKIITANGPDATEEFTNAILKLI